MDLISRKLLPFVIQMKSMSCIVSVTICEGVQILSVTYLCVYYISFLLILVHKKSLLLVTGCLRSFLDDLVTAWSSLNPQFLFCWNLFSSWLLSSPLPFLGQFRLLLVPDIYCPGSSCVVWMVELLIPLYWYNLLWFLTDLLIVTDDQLFRFLDLLILSDFHLQL
jgi:hypothetical protein